MENEQSFTMPADEADQQNIPEEESSSIKKNLISLVIGAIVLISIPATVAYIFIHHKNSTKPAQTVSQTIVNPSYLSSTQPTTVTQSMQQTSTKSYQDTGYMMQIPKDWDATKQAVGANASQVSVHPGNSSDVPLTINIVSQPGSTVDDWINQQFGMSAARSTKAVNGIQATFVPTNTGFSYFIKHDATLYQISAVTTKKDYANAINMVLSSFSLQ